MLRERGSFCAALGHSGQCCYDPRRSLATGPFRESPAARLPDRRRRKSRPETLRQQQRQTFSAACSRRRATASSGEWWRLLRDAIHRRGAALRRLISQVTGQRGGRSHRHCEHLPLLFACGCVLQPEDLWDDTHHSMSCIAAKARASSILAAGTCRCSTPRRSRSTTPYAARRAYLTSRTCASSMSAGARTRDFLRYLLANDVAKLDAHGPGALQLHAQSPRAACSTISSPIISMSRGFAWSSTPARATRISPGSGATRRTLASRYASARIWRCSPCRDPRRARRPRRCCPRRRARARLRCRCLSAAKSDGLVHRAHRLHG